MTENYNKAIEDFLKVVNQVWYYLYEGDSHDVANAEILAKGIEEFKKAIRKFLDEQAEL